MTAETGELLSAALSGDKYALARLISVFERDGRQYREARISIMRSLGRSPAGRVIGWTGSPGAGKSTLLGVIAQHLLETTDLRIGILAIDPSSRESGGSLLGDRTRTRLPLKEPRIFFRSQASELDLGGMGRSTFSVTRLLCHFFDLIFIETVGIGQTETEVRELADRVYLVMMPFSGDQIQFMKSGIMEIPDAFIINKCDEEKLAAQSFHQLKSSLSFLQLPGSEKQLPPVFLTSALKKKGISELAADLEGCRRSPEISLCMRTAPDYFLRKAVAMEYGRHGLNILSEAGFSPGEETYEEAEDRAFSLLERKLKS